MSVAGGLMLFRIAAVTLAGWRAASAASPQIVVFVADPEACAFATGGVPPLLPVQLLGSTDQSGGVG